MDKWQETSQNQKCFYLGSPIADLNSSLVSTLIVRCKESSRAKIVRYADTEGPPNPPNFRVREYSQES